mmetsp:Transcript_14295/g.42037  ORF Transcript_14295/g.42037 Transcript_14295/m.42037 type:complete len:348 (+) Transcript_14295:464-1507(+)
MARREVSDRDGDARGLVPAVSRPSCRAALRAGVPPCAAAEAVPGVASSAAAGARGSGAGAASLWALRRHRNKQTSASSLPIEAPPPPTAEPPAAPPLLVPGTRSWCRGESVGLAARVSQGVSPSASGAGGSTVTTPSSPARMCTLARCASLRFSKRVSPRPWMASRLARSVPSSEASKPRAADRGSRRGRRTTPMNPSCIEATDAVARSVTGDVRMPRARSRSPWEKNSRLRRMARGTDTSWGRMGPEISAACTMMGSMAARSSGELKRPAPLALAPLAFAPLALALSEVTRSKWCFMSVDRTHALMRARASRYWRRVRVPSTFHSSRRRIPQATARWWCSRTDWSL